MGGLPMLLIVCIWRNYFIAAGFHQAEFFGDLIQTTAYYCPDHQLLRQTDQSGGAFVLPRSIFNCNSFRPQQKRTFMLHLLTIYCAQVTCGVRVTELDKAVAIIEGILAEKKASHHASMPSICAFHFITRMLSGLSIVSASLAVGCQHPLLSSLQYLYNKME
eukprot:scaffold253200_cov28-Prasinocladus_malaysianus.AAC.1